MSLVHTGSFFYRDPKPLLGHDTVVPSGISAYASGAVVVTVLFSVVYNGKID
jgi:hypothetical protein